MDAQIKDQLTSMNFTAALRISNCRGSLASLLRLYCSLAHYYYTCSYPSQNFISKSLRPRLSKDKNFVVIVVIVMLLLLLRYLGLYRESSAGVFIIKV